MNKKNTNGRRSVNDDDDTMDTGTNQPLYARDADLAEGVYAKQKGTPKCVRVIVVCIYLFTVSFAALLLSAYYIFFWKPTMEDFHDDRPERLTACDNDN